MLALPPRRALCLGCGRRNCLAGVDKQAPSIVCRRTIRPPRTVARVAPAPSARGVTEAWKPGPTAPKMALGPDDRHTLFTDFQSVSPGAFSVMQVDPSARRVAPAIHAIRFIARSGRRLRSLRSGRRFEATAFPGFREPGACVARWRLSPAAHTRQPSADTTRSRASADIASVDLDGLCKIAQQGRQFFQPARAG